MITNTTTGPLQQARDLEMPHRESMLRRDASVQRFWHQHRDLLVDAWSEWDHSANRPTPVLDSSLIDERLRDAVTQAWENPTKESGVQDLLTEAAPGVFSFQFFDPDRLADLRSYLDDVWNAGIPLRPPYGILLNRGGAMLDPRSEGYLAAPTFQTLYRELLDTYMRPISRLVYPEVTGYDTQGFGFSINYKPTTESSIRPHSDASSVTLNINVNTPGEEFTGSTVDFFDRATGSVHVLTFEPGTAMIHRGHVPHTAQPILTGERTNLVLWLYGNGGQIPTTDTPLAPLSAHQRWTGPANDQDGFAPF